MYFKSCLAASFSMGSFSDPSSIANMSFCRNSALSSKFILASKQTTKFLKKGRYMNISYDLQLSSVGLQAQEKNKRY